MTVQRVETLVYGVEKEYMADGIRFYEDFGLGVVEKGKNGAVFKTRENQHIVVKPADDPSLPATFETGSTVRETVFGVDSQDALDAIGAEISKDREVTQGSEGVLQYQDPGHLNVGFRVSAIEPVAVEAPLLNFQDAVPRVNKRIVNDADSAILDQGQQIHPLRIGHVVVGPARRHPRRGRDILYRAAQLQAHRHRQRHG